MGKKGVKREKSSPVSVLHFLLSINRRLIVNSICVIKPIELRKRGKGRYISIAVFIFKFRVESFAGNYRETEDNECPISFHRINRFKSVLKALPKLLKGADDDHQRAASIPFEIRIDPGPHPPLIVQLSSSQFF